MATATGRRRVVTTKNVQKSDIDELSNRLATKLKVTTTTTRPTTATRSARKPVQPPSNAKSNVLPKSDEDRKASLMKNINSTLQTLSAAIQSGWKASEGRKRSTFNNLDLAASAKSARCSLSLLRGLMLGNLDVEKAALSLVGKLLSTELFESASETLKDVREGILIAYQGHGDEETGPTSLFSLLRLPIPSSSVSLDPSLQTIISSYFSHALSSVVQLGVDRSLLDGSFVVALAAPGCFASWIPHLTALPVKTVDTILKRNYMLLTTISVNPSFPLSASLLLDIRFFALRSLLLSSDVDANAFWEQCMKFAGSYIKASAASGTEGSSDVLLNCFSDVVHCAEQRQGDGDLMSGPSWVAFCEYWLVIARKACNIETVDRVVHYIQKSPSSSKAVIPPSSSTGQILRNADVSHEAAKICAGFLQMTAFLDSTNQQDKEEFKRRTETATELVEEYGEFLQSEVSSSVDSKLKRSAERLRRSVIKRLEKPSPEDELLRSLLKELVYCIQSCPVVDADSTITILDSLFHLATSGLDIQKANTCDEAYIHLTKAEEAIQTYSSSTADQNIEKNVANYLRCTSCAYFNVAGSLFKGEKFGLAIRFLKRACPLAESSLEKYELATSKIMANGNKEHTDGDEDKDQEVWASHKVQLYKRWELLGVCYAKLPDRKLAYEAFVKAIATFPYDSTFSSTVLKDPSLDVFSAPEYRSLGTLIDRVTYIGAAELFLEKDTSLLRSLQGLPAEVAVAILERQISSLSDSKWKPAIGKVVEALLSDLLSLLGDDQSIRRAKLLITQLEHIYYSGNTIQMFHVEEISSEIRRLLDLASNASPIDRHARLHYSALAHLWLALLMHAEPSSNSQDAVLSHSNEAHGFLASLLSSISSRSTSKFVKEAALPTKANGKAPAGVKKRPATKPTRAPVSKTPRTPARPVAEEITRNDTVVAQELLDLLSVTRIVVELLGLMGHTYAKMQLLVIARQLAAEIDGAVDVQIEASIDFGYELVKLGKVNQAIEVYTSALKSFGKGKLPTCHYVLLQLRYAEALAITGDIAQSVAMYEEASNSCDLLSSEDKAPSMLVRTRERVMAIERSATASVVFGTIQLTKNFPAMALKSYLQALRLLNRSVDCLSKLTTPKSPAELNGNQDPFSTSDLKNALDDVAASEPPQTAYKRTLLGGHEWRVASSLFDVMFTLSTVYFMRGSYREAEYFAKQAEDLARCINSPAVLCRALSRQSELLLFRGQLDEASEKLEQAATSIRPTEALIDSAETSRLKGDHFQKLSLASNASQMYEAAAKTLEEIGETFVAFDYQNDGRRKSNIASPKSPQSIKVPVAPTLLALILKQHIWLLRDDEENFDNLLQRFTALPQSADVQAQANSLLGRLALHNIHERFLRDMALNSLAESTVALPMGMLCEGVTMRPSSRDVVEALNGAEEIYSTGLDTFYERGSITHMRESAVSLALVKAFQAALGATGKEGPAMAARFLDLASSITLQKELVECIQYKFPELGFDDLQWPSFSPRAPQVKPHRQKPTIQNIFDDSDDEEESEQEGHMRKYWESVLKRHSSEILVDQGVPRSELDRLPPNWVVVSISLTEDKGTLLLSRQSANKEPFIFCIPLRGRRENDDEEHFTFDDAVAELKDIISCSDEGTRQASRIGKEDREGKAAWWAERKSLDERMKSLLENIEFCWLGAFKTILAQPTRIPPDIIPAFRSRIEKVFKDMLKPHEKKLKKTKFKLESCLLELFATLPANCRDEELEDIVYFILDLYHFHGVQISSADIDVDVVGVDLRTAFEEHHRRTRGRIVPEPDAHTFLVLDKNVQGIPWESIPILRGKSVSRIPSISFLLDRMDLAMVQRGLAPTEDSEEIIDRVVVDPSSAYYVLNPAGDLSGTEGRFKDWIEKMRKVGWEGIVGRPPSEQQLLNALSRKDLVVYFGHGGAEQYVRSHKIRHLQQCAATMLWGCSSGALRDMGDFERIGTPNNYMLAGCPTLVANLWDVTDRDIDKFALSVFDKLALQPEEVKKWKTGKKCAADCRVSVVTAVAQSREVCKLKYLTGAAVVVYGIPFYL